METKSEGGICLNDMGTFFAVHPGDILREELKSRGIKQVDFARKIGMEPSHLSALIHGARNVTVAIADRLEHGLGIPASFWMNLQTTYNLDKKRLREQVPVLAEPESPVYGAKRTVQVRFPEKDFTLFQELCSRLGWEWNER